MKRRNFIRDIANGGLTLTGVTGSFLSTSAFINKRVSYAKKENVKAITRANGRSPFT